MSFVSDSWVVSIREDTFASVDKDAQDRPGVYPSSLAGGQMSKVREYGRWGI